MTTKRVSRGEGARATRWAREFDPLDLPHVCGSLRAFSRAEGPRARGILGSGAGDFGLIRGVRTAGMFEVKFL